MVVALVALFVALGGPAQAARLIDGHQIRKGTITSRQIKNGSIARADLSRTAVRSLTATPLNSVRSSNIIDGQVLAPDIGAGAVTSASLLDSSVGNANLAPGSVSASKIAPGAIGGAAIADGSLQTVDLGSFTGSVLVDFPAFDDASNRCRAANAPAMAAGGQPNIADDVVVVSPPASWSDYAVVSGKPAPGNQIRIVVCWVPPNAHDTDSFDPPPTVFRYVTFDAP